MTEIVNSLSPSRWRMFKHQFESGMMPISNLGEAFCQRFNIYDKKIKKLYQDDKGWRTLENYVALNMPLGENLEEDEVD